MLTRPLHCSVCLCPRFCACSNQCCSAKLQTSSNTINNQDSDVLLNMQATLPKKISVEGGTFKPYMRGVYMAYAFVCYCYFTVAICGYWAFGQAVQDNVLLSIRHPKWVVAVADMFVVVHVFGSYQVSNTTVAHVEICVGSSGLWQFLICLLWVMSLVAARLHKDCTPCRFDNGPSGLLQLLMCLL